jgi:hypothetical protein
VVSGRLWYQSCQQLNQDLPSDLPVSFASPQQYIAAYEPLIFEEARESILHSKLDKFSLQAQATILGYATRLVNTIGNNLPEGQPLLSGLSNHPRVRCLLKLLLFVFKKNGIGHNLPVAQISPSRPTNHPMKRCSLELVLKSSYIMFQLDNYFSGPGK